MKDNVQIAGHLQDVVRGLGDVEHAVRSQPQPRVDVPANVVVVNVPGARDEKALEPAPPPVVNVTVPVPIVNVSAPAVSVDVPAPTPVSYRVTVTSRDDQGLIRTFVIEPVL